MTTEENAMVEYAKGLAIVDEALRIRVHDSDCKGKDWDKARTLFDKMEDNKANVQGRLSKLRESMILYCLMLSVLEIHKTNPSNLSAGFCRI